MRSRRPLELTLPAPRRWPRGVIAASVAAHVVLLWIVLHNRWIPLLQPPVEEQVVLVALPAPGTPAPAPVVARQPVVAPTVRVGVPPASPNPGKAVSPVEAVVPPHSASAADTGGSVTASRIGPGYAHGKLWVEPQALPTPELAARALRGHVVLVDSATRAIIQAFLDSIAADSASKAAMLPSWTTTIAGQKFGLDSRYIYIAGLKIPAAVLALLPLPHGNESQAFDRSSWLYDDLRYAAQRSANMEDFKREIADIRARTEAARRFEQNRRTPPPKEQPQ